MFNSTFLKAFLVACLVIGAPHIAAAQVESEATQQTEQLDINKADAATIAATLDGVGLIKAQEIVAYRDAFGSFRSIEELLEVKGIGATTVERNRHRILIVNN